MSIKALGQIPYASNVRAYTDSQNLTIGAADADWMPAGVTFVKRRDDTNLVFMVLGAGYAGVAGRTGVFTVRIDGTNYPAGAFTQNFALSYHGWCIFAEVPGINAGSHTVGVRGDGSGSSSIIGQTTAQQSLLVMECMPARVDPDDVAVPRMLSWSMQQSAAATTTSASYATTGLTRSITKRSADTRLVALFLGSAFVTGAVATNAEFAVDIDGTSTLIANHDINVLSHHDFFAGAVELPGIAAGARTVTLKWRRASGTGTVTMDTNDTVSLLLMELP